MQAGLKGTVKASSITESEVSTKADKAAVASAAARVRSLKPYLDEAQAWRHMRMRLFLMAPREMCPL